MYLEYTTEWNSRDIDLLINSEYRDMYRNRKRPRRDLEMTENGINRAGYIDIKHHPKVKGRKLKSWKKKWVVVNQMSNLAAGTSVAKVDVYTDEKTATKSPSDKHTVVLEGVTNIRPAKSKTHNFAFEVVETEPVLLLAAANELDTQSWIWTLRKIFWPEQNRESATESFTVRIVDNQHTERLSLRGDYTMTITPDYISITTSSTSNSYEWSLSKLRRFYLGPETDEGNINVLVIESGPKSECGEGTFKFKSDSIEEILASIKKNIFIAINKKKKKRDQTSPRVSQTERPTFGHERTSTTSSLNTAESRILALLESPGRNRANQSSFSGSESSQSRHEDECIRLHPKTRSLERRKTEGDIIGVSILTEPSIGPTQANISTDCDSGVATTDCERVKPKVDLLTDTNDVEKTDDDSIYNRTDLKAGCNVPISTSNIISTFTVASTDYQTRILLDDHGYSHVAQVSNRNVGDKTRSLSSISSQSGVSMRSISVGSRDSGTCIQGQGITEPDNSSKESLVRVFHRSSNSFDSAVSTASVIEQTSSRDTFQTTTPYTVEIQEVEISGQSSLAEQPDATVVPTNSQSNISIYQEVSIPPESNNKTDSKQTLLKFSSSGNFAAQENHYEELDTFRKGKKDLSKLLGMDPHVVDPLSVPPSLPDRPTSHKIKRKVLGSTDRKLFTLPFSKSKNKKNRERAASISSDSDTDSSGGTKKPEIRTLQTLQAWPLSSMSVLENNDLYQPVAIERFLEDKEDGSEGQLMRERSSSLNLDMKSNLKRHSIALSTETMIDSVSWGRKRGSKKHSRNASLNIELSKENETPNSGSLFEGFRKPFGTAPCARKATKDSSATHDVKGHTFNDYHDDEPIYAEVQPILESIEALTARTANLDDPFPNLETWEPQHDVSSFNLDFFEKMENKAKPAPELSGNLDCSTASQKSDLKDLSKEQKTVGVDAHPTEEFDIFNAGFHEQSQLDCSTDILVDINSDETTPSDSVNQSSQMMDIFSLGFNSHIEPTKVGPVASVDKPMLSQTCSDLEDIFNMGTGCAVPSFYTSILDQTSGGLPGLCTDGRESGTNWADFSQVDTAGGITSGDENPDPVYMDMSTTCISDNVYVMPSQVTRNVQS